MTAEIAVMNKSAIALAADSKVTVVGGGSATKTYDTMNKLFTLSKIAPVAVMVYGNAEYMHYPWETVIKMYRQQNGRQVFPTVNAWADDFFSWVDSFGQISKSEKDNNVANICQAFLADIEDELLDIAIEERISIDSGEYNSRYITVLENKARSIIRNFEAWTKSRGQASFLKSIGPILARVVDNFYNGKPDDLKEAAILFLGVACIYKYNSPQVSGVVVAGFGEDEIFPSLVEYRTEGYVGRRVKRWKTPPDVDVSRSNSGVIRAFAQHEMVQRFMTGIDPSYAGYLRRGIPELVFENCEATLKKYGLRAKQTEAVKDEIRQAITAAVGDFTNRSQAYRREFFSDPVMNMVTLLPIDELANLAESLVALTSLKRRVSNETETVGGAIDVAVISKGDGFIWVKRKHYFSPEFNPQFDRNYLNGM